MGVRDKTPFIGVRCVLLAAGIAGITSLCLGGAAAQITRTPRAIQAIQAIQATQATDQTVQWRRGAPAEELRRAKIVRITHDFHAADLATLRDDQMLETPSGRRVSVKAIRGIYDAIAKAKARPRAPEEFQILPPPTKPCTPTRPGESFSEILARPDSDVVCVGKNNSAVSVAQLRLMKPYIERTRGLDVSPAIVGRAALSGPAITITDNRQLATLLQTRLKDAPGSTVLVNPKGQRVTLGSVRAALKIKPELLVRPIPSNDRRR
jgi:hypothetical protein